MVPCQEFSYRFQAHTVLIVQFKFYNHDKQPLKPK